MPQHMVRFVEAVLQELVGTEILVKLYELGLDIFIQ